MSVAQRLGAERVGLEGDPVTMSRCRIWIFALLIWNNSFLSPEGFPLALCLEVGEHLSQERSNSLVHDLCSLSDCVLFSAAIPGQGGANHINEQWQSWWARLFAENDFILFHCIRPRVWSNRAVEQWYCQNMFLYVDKTKSATLALPSNRNSTLT